MSISIDSNSIRKLVHENDEIRWRALKHIQSKILRALNLGEIIDFKPGELIKYLIRWFGYKPITGQDEVLALILKILQSYSKETIEYLGIDRLKREMCKVKKILNGCKEVSLVENIQKFLEDYSILSDGDDIIEIIDCQSVSDAQSTSRESPAHHLRNETYEIPWSKPAAIDYNAMNNIVNILKGKQSSQNEVMNALQHLQITFYDYPAEYALQPPHIFRELLGLYHRYDASFPFERITESLDSFLRLLYVRIRIRQKPVAFVKQVSSADLHTQISSPKVCTHLLDLFLNYLHENIFDSTSALSQVFQLLGLTMKIMQTLSQEQIMEIDWSSVKNFCKVAKHLRLSFETDDHPAINRIKYLLVIILLQNISEIHHNALGKSNEEFNIMLLDLPFAEYYPHRYNILKKQCDIGTKMQILLNAKDFLQDAVCLLKNPDTYSDEEIIMKGSKILSTLSIHESMTLVERLYLSIQRCIPMYEKNGQLRSIADKLFLLLLSHENERIKVNIYTKASTEMKKFFASLMNGENVFACIKNMKLIELKIIGIPLSSDLLTEIICFGLENTNPTIRQCSDDILSLLLRGRNLFSSNWKYVLEILLPVFPLLQCANSIKITSALLTLLNPDDKNLPALDLLKGNLRYLFHPQTDVRSESLFRLTYILTSRPDAPELLPNIMEISDLLPNDMCIQKVPRDANRIFSGSQFDHSSVKNVLNLLSLPDMEPLIRKTTLVQLNVMCQDEETNRLVLMEGGFIHCIQALENSLRKSSRSDYSDSSIPAIGVLSKILFCDPEFRRDLSMEDNIFVLLLRALFQYVNDISVRQDASLCLFMLLFSSCIVGSNRKIEIPRIMTNLQLPIKCCLQSASSPYAVRSELEKIYLQSTEEIGIDERVIYRFFRMQMASVYSKGITKINREYLENQKNLDINSKLHLTRTDFRLICSTSIHDIMSKILKELSNTTEHTALINGTNLLKLTMTLPNEEVENDNNTAMSINSSEETIIKIFRRYIEMPPTNELELLLFDNAMSIFETCIQSSKIQVISWLFQTLEDFQHPLVAILQNSEISLRLYYKITRIIVGTVIGHKPNKKHAIFYCNLFEYLDSLAEIFLKKRELNRVRCLFSLMETISRRALHLDCHAFHRSCKKFLNYSLALKSNTQTGSHWQKNCLLIICNLVSQRSINEFRLNGKYIKYLSGLCSHNDFQVKTLAWSLLGKLANNTDLRAQLLDELSFLPGGFQACCLSSFLDTSEVSMVRHLAGNVFVDLMRINLNFDELQQILKKQYFYQTAQESLEYFTPNAVELSGNVAEQGITCNIIHCYCRIFNKLLDINSRFTEELCEKPILYKLYCLAKIPNSFEVNDSFFAMTAEICQLYSRCFPKCFLFLQRTVCRDELFIHSICSLLNVNFNTNIHLINILNICIVISKDQVGFRLLCENLSKFSKEITNLLHSFIDVSLIKSIELQRTAFNFLLHLLFKSQEISTHITFVEILDTTIIAQNCCSSQFILIEMSKLLNHLFSNLQASKFEIMPSATKILLCDCMAMLLKSSEEARTAAKNTKLLEKIINIFNIFLENFTIPSTTYIRRYGDGKKIPIIQNMLILFNIILLWHSNDRTVLCNESEIMGITKVIIQIWQWTTHSYELKILILRCLAFTSERSIPVCKQFSIIITGYSSSILQLVAKLVIMETNKVRSSANDDNSLIEIGLRTIMNCCVCQEGRNSLVKLHILDIFDTLHPFNLKSQKSKIDTLLIWLQFWELFSRYPEGAQCRNIIALCTIINGNVRDRRLRIMCLRILRNMSFLSANRTALLASTDFICTVDQTLSKCNDVCDSEEKLLVSLAVWKLISGGMRYSSLIKNTKLEMKFKRLSENLNTAACAHIGKSEKPEECSLKDLTNVIRIILRILDT